MQNLRYYCRWELKPWQTSNEKLAVNTELGLNILLFKVQIKPHDSLSNLKTYWNERVSYQRTIIHIFPQYEGNVWVL